MQVIVVGGGAPGLASAVALAREGHAVQLLERERTGQRASWVAAGLLTPSSPWSYPRPLVELCVRSEALYPAFVADLHRHTGVDPEYDAAGMIYPIGAGQDRRAIEEAALRRTALGMPCEIVERAALDRLQPGLGPSIAAAAWQLRSARVRPPRLMAALARRAAQLGVQLVDGCEVLELLPGGVRVRRADDGTCTQLLQADVVVLAAGAWSTGLAATAGIAIDVRPVRGQILLLAGAPGLLAPTVNDGEGYLVPRRDGRILVGSTMEEAGFDETNTAEALDALRRAARQLLPATAWMAEESWWAGLRPGTPDRVPYIGWGAPGLLLATGHFRNGILLAPVTAAIVADLVAGRRPDVDLSLYAPGRTVDATADMVHA